MTTIQYVQPAGRIIVPLDGMTEGRAVSEAAALKTAGISLFKIGKELINRGEAGTLARHIMAQGGLIFWDNKDRDILTTMVAAAKSANDLGVFMFNVFADAGPEKLKAVAGVKGLARALAVTVLTDVDDVEARVLYEKPVVDMVRKLARWAEEAGLDGIICSPKDLGELESAGLCHDMLKVCPGVRPEWAATNDQKRVTTPREAVEKGADYLVIGRPITKPPEEIGSSARAVELIVEEISAAQQAA